MKTGLMYLMLPAALFLILFLLPNQIFNIFFTGKFASTAAITKQLSIPFIILLKIVDLVCLKIIIKNFYSNLIIRKSMGTYYLQNIIRIFFNCLQNNDLLNL